MQRYDDPATPVARSIFLAGPTSRAPVRTPWRAELITICERAGFDGELVIRAGYRIATTLTECVERALVE